MLGVYLGLNLGTHFDIDRRQGLKLGAGLEEWPGVDPLSLSPCLLPSAETVLE
jgi:hypothetical protein